MITLNKNTKKAQGFLKSYIRAEREGNTSLHSIYEKPSALKMAIAKDIELGANGATVYYMGGNSFSFTCGYIMECTGEFFVFTKSNLYKIQL